MRCGISVHDLRALPADEGRALVEMLEWDETDRIRRLGRKAMTVIDVGSIG